MADTDETKAEEAIAQCVNDILFESSAIAIAIPEEHDQIAPLKIQPDNQSRESSFATSTASDTMFENDRRKLVFDYAIIVKLSRRGNNSPTKSPVKQLTDTQFNQEAVAKIQAIAKRLVYVGFHVRLETRWSEKKKQQASHLKVILLVYAPEGILSTHKKKLEVERWIEGGRYGEHILNLSRPKMTSADRLVLVDRLLYMPFEDGGVGLSDFESIISKAFPLHDDEFNREIVSNWFYKWKDYFRNNDDQIDNIRLHFGEKAGLYFAFMDFYTKWLIPIAIWGVLIYIVSAFSAMGYFQLLGITGVFVSSIWGTLFLIFWKRKRSAIRLKWGVGQLEHVNVLNPDYQGVPRFDVPTGVVKLYYPTYKRRLKYVFGYFILLVFIAVETVVTIGFVDLYFFFKSGCAGGCSTGGFENWILVLCQGILLGLVVDIIQYQIFRVIAVALTNWENHRTEKRYETSRALKIFLWDFFGIYSWFWMCAFVYIPYGQQFSDLINEYHILPWPSSYRPGLLVLGNIFITPLVVTQSLKIVFEKMIPYFLLKGAKKAMGSKGNYDVYQTAIAQDFYTPNVSAPKPPPSPQFSEIMVLGLKNVSRKLSSSPRKAQSTSEVSPKKSTIDKPKERRSRGCITNLSVPLAQQNAFHEQRRRFVDRVLEQAHQSPHDNFADYADMCVQFGYVSQFTCIWPFIPLCAVVNNVFEVRSTAFQLAYASARRVPQRTSSIGSWNMFLKFNNIWAIFINIALICYASGLLESFYSDCYLSLGQIGYGEHLPPLVPNFTCLSSDERLKTFLILEHSFVIVYVLLYLTIPVLPSDVKRIMRKKDKEIKEHFVSQLQLFNSPQATPDFASLNLVKHQLFSVELKTILVRVENALTNRRSM
ncbi:transmembrane protein [Thraustotheca clavata]|uniref:Transmembrane protein n=1 Tax=Thraustotheca clavata TaxID=74557 RepID=A0A1V9ZIS3_9STRA|nr:transmembrane protein [Thraustotheca clavata]